MSQNVAIRVQTEGKAEVKRDWQEMGQAGVDAHTAIARASDNASANLDRQMAKWKQLAAAAKEAEAIQQRQGAFNSFLGIGGAGKSAADSAAAFEALMPANADARLSNVQMQELTHSARAMFDSLAAGTNPVRVLAMESGRLAQTMGNGQGGLGATFKALGAVALEWAGPVGVLAVVVGGIALLVEHFHAAKAEAEDLKKAQQGLTVTQHAGMEAISHAIEFSEKYHVSSSALYGSLEQVITSQGAMNDVVHRGIGVTDDMARAARDRAEAERLLTVEMLRQAAAEATKRAGDARKKQGGFLGIPDQANIAAALVGIGLAGSPDALGAAQQAHDDYIKAHLDPLKQVEAQEKSLAASLSAEADAYGKVTLQVNVRNESAEAGARKAAEAARKAAEEAKKRQAEELKLESIRVANFLEIAKLRGDKSTVTDLEAQAHAQALVNQYVEAGLTLEQARRAAAIEGGKEQLAEAQGRIAAIVKEGEGMKTLAQLTANWSKVRPFADNQAALDDFGKTEEHVFDTLASDLEANGKGFKDWAQTVGSAILDVIAELEKLAIINPFENYLFGKSGPLAVTGYQAKPALGGGGFMSFISSLFGGGSSGFGGSGTTNFLPGNANGTDNFAGGWTMVGERGPEPVWMPRGSKVMSNAQMTGGGLGGANVSITIDARGADASAARNVQAAVDQLKAQLPGMIVSTVNDGLSRGYVGKK